VAIDDEVWVPDLTKLLDLAAKSKEFRYWVSYLGEDKEWGYSIYFNTICYKFVVGLTPPSNGDNF
jgi:hypothetical protein